MTDEPGIAELCQSLGHSFRRPALLREALSHPSLGGPVNYQRLEFLGDRVLGLVIAEALCMRFPARREGVLARYLADLVRRDTLAEVARSCGIDRQIFMAPSAEDEGGRSSPAILGDVCEAVIGALYLDGGLEAARQFIEREWADYFTDTSRGARDPKSALQEWAQGLGLAVPVYREIGRSGPDHAPEFTVEVTVEGQAPAIGAGSSKRTAEREAASAMLERIGK